MKKYDGPESTMLHTNFFGSRSTSSGKEDFEGFYHIRALEPSWSCNPDAANKFCSPSHVDLT